MGYGAQALGVVSLRNRLHYAFITTPALTGGGERMAMTVVEAFDPNEIRLTDNAASKVRALVEDEGNPGLKLRVYITGGGCSGFQYGSSFDESVSEDDMVVERNGATALIDAMSYQYLVGSELDYSEGLEGSRFVVNNPNATTTCGCGASFSI